MFGWFRPDRYFTNDKSLRREVYRIAKDHNKKVIVIDTGFIGGKDYYSVGFDGLKGKAYYGDYLIYPSDRWKKLNLRINNYKESGNVLVLGQNRFGISCWEIDIFKWHVDICRKIHRVTNLPIIFRKHPRAKLDQPNDKFPEFVKISQNEDIIDDIAQAKYCVTYTTNGACQALQEGCYSISYSPQNMIYECSDHNINVIGNEPTQFSREKRQNLFNKISYCQWTEKEMKSGECWSYVKGLI